MPDPIAALYTAYSGSACASRVPDLEAALQGACGEELNALYETLERLGEDSPWQVRLLQADGGIQRFDIILVIANCRILVDTVDRNHYPVWVREEGVRGLLKWMERCVDLIYGQLAGDAILQALFQDTRDTAARRRSIIGTQGGR